MFMHKVLFNMQFPSFLLKFGVNLWNKMLVIK